MAAPKVLVFGALNGALKPAFTKAATLHSKNKFDFAIISGNLFAESDDETAASLLNGEIAVPLPTYFTVGTSALPAAIVAKIEANEEICENLHFLGKRSVTKTTDGVRHDAKTLKGAGQADILLTTVWPAGVWTGSKTALIPENQALTTSTQEEGSEERPVTRFISMAPYGNATKAKAMYAFTLSLGSTSLDQPAGTTASPFAARVPKRKPLDDAPYSRFADSHDGKRHRGKRGRNRSPPPGPERCFFCLSNPNLSLHMVATIGEDSYLATAKGPLAKPTTFTEHGINFPGHIIITPMAHTPTIASTSAESYSAADAQRTLDEMTRFRESLQAMVAAKSGHKLGAITGGDQPRPQHPQPLAVPPPCRPTSCRGASSKPVSGVEAEKQQVPGPRGPRPADAREPAGRRRLLSASGCGPTMATTVSRARVSSCRCPTRPTRRASISSTLAALLPSSLAWRTASSGRTAPRLRTRKRPTSTLFARPFASGTLRYHPQQHSLFLQWCLPT
ncbi:cwfJ domain-containing protein [Verticillium alfalfae VaMs.102]|uniref:CwfJ domain-containing protein n=1 Tax=Verticillium alfalfae (strain VaMs.102 / ATCC MYA-4576 / FGSC 10136) TaxID=526221 RepID=C9SJ00_VERA1|nr:cwfJ domain-containing protein [Verticillium alfalfae VaMs.102]EEY18923.1 cwfJ domain-containing protein [Verticillium alfalfae VaMs.102]